MCKFCTPQNDETKLLFFIVCVGILFGWCQRWIETFLPLFHLPRFLIIRKGLPLSWIMVLDVFENNKLGNKLVLVWSVSVSVCMCEKPKINVEVFNFFLRFVFVRYRHISKMIYDCRLSCVYWIFFFIKFENHIFSLIYLITLPVLVLLFIQWKKRSRRISTDWSEKSSSE